MIQATAELGGRQLSWLQSGQGKPLVLLHAFPLHAEMFAGQHAAVPHGWMLVTPDLRNLGRSGGPRATSVGDHADDVLALMRHLGIERAVVGGVSMGGYVTFALLRKAPQRCRALVLADTRADADTEDTRKGRLAMQETARAQGVAAVADAMVPKLLGKTSLATSQLPSQVRELILANRVDGVVDALDALRTRPDSSPLLPSILAPALVLVGEEDMVTPVPLAEAMQSLLPNARLTIVPRAGHLANLEQPDAFNTALWDLLRAL
jgi:pimeloyl-ACP methyl ester carboxylesterase